MSEAGGRVATKNIGVRRCPASLIPNKQATLRRNHKLVINKVS